LSSCHCKFIILLLIKRCDDCRGRLHCGGDRRPTLVTRMISTPNTQRWASLIWQSTDWEWIFRRRPDRDGRGVCTRNATRACACVRARAKGKGKPFPTRLDALRSSHFNAKSTVFLAENKFRFSDHQFIASYRRQLTIYTFPQDIFRVASQF
jgi:hypothetical protein